MTRASWYNFETALLSIIILAYLILTFFRDSLPAEVNHYGGPVVVIAYVVFLMWLWVYNKKHGASGLKFGRRGEGPKQSDIAAQSLNQGSQSPARNASMRFWRMLTGTSPCGFLKPLLYGLILVVLILTFFGDSLPAEVNLYGGLIIVIVYFAVLRWLRAYNKEHGGVRSESGRREEGQEQSDIAAQSPNQGSQSSTRNASIRFRRMLAGALITPLAPAILLLLGQLIRQHNLDLAAASAKPIPVVFVAVPYVLLFVLGAPIHFILRRLRRAEFYVYIAAGFVVGMLSVPLISAVIIGWNAIFHPAEAWVEKIPYLFNHIFPPAVIAGFLTAPMGLLFWIIARPDKA